MGMSNAERQKKFRLNRDLDPEKRQEYLQKERDRNIKKKEKGMLKSVKDMTPREKRTAKRHWRNQKRKERAKVKAMKEMLTPPTSPETTNRQEASRQKKQITKMQKKKVAKCYRDNMHLKKEVVKQISLVKKFKRRLERQNEKIKKMEHKTDTPRTKTRKLLRCFPKKTIVKTLIFQSALIDQIKEKYKKKLQKGQKKDIDELLHGSILRKYRVKTAAARALGIRVRNENYRVKERKSLSRAMYTQVREFYERDDISRMTSGVKNTVTANKLKKQRRVLNDSLRNLHVKFLSEINGRISYKTFCRLRPFWVKFPTDRDRNTCLCRLCDNTQLMASALRKANVLNTGNLEEIVKETVCDIHQEECMFNNCSKCKGKRMELNRNIESEDIQWHEWKTKTEKRNIKDGKGLKEKEVSFTVKEQISGTISELSEKFEDQIVRYKKHQFIYRWQYGYLRKRKEDLKENECVIQIDWSENYECKLPEEVQGMHFGASKKQLSLHTGVFYIGGKHKTFCTVSDNLHHGPGGIWAHLEPILSDIKRNNPKINSVEFFSDGPTSQYRQKYNFFMFVSETYRLGFEKAEWNFFEAGHGKGVPDAVGGSIKRKADQKVKYGASIVSAKSFIDTVKDSETKLLEIQDHEIECTRNKLKTVNPKPLPGTLKLHQIKSFNPGSLCFRDLSCVCNAPNECQGHKLKYHTFSSVCTEKPSNDSKLEKPKVQKTDDSKSEHQGITERMDCSDRKRQTMTTTVNNYNQVLHELKNCKAFEQLRTKCLEISDSFNDFETIPQSVTFLTTDQEVDIEAMENYPDDVPDSRALYPSTVPADGNCLPYCGSVFGYGTTEFSTEMRLRILSELVLHEDVYLDNKFLLQGMSEAHERRNILKSYAMYSDMFVPGMVLNDDTIKSIYRMEVHKIRISNSFMGMWQIHALSSVLKVPVFSIYPKKGSPVVRKDLNRLVIPRQGSSNNNGVPVYILWTSTRNDEMVSEHWIPNHFVPCLPIEENACDDSDVSDSSSEVSDQHSRVTEADKTMEDACSRAEVPEVQETGKPEKLGDYSEKSERTVETGEITKMTDRKQDMREGIERTMCDNVKREESTLEAGGFITDTERGKLEVEAEDQLMEEEGKKEAEGGKVITEEGKIESEGDQTEAEVYKMEADGDQLIADKSKIETEGAMEAEMISGVDKNAEETMGCTTDTKCKEGTYSSILEAVGGEMESEVSKLESEEKMDTDGLLETEDAQEGKTKAEEVDMNWQNIPSPLNCIGKYVIVQYGKNAYPGYVEDAGEHDVYVQCMHGVGRKQSNCFYWPKKLIDRCWYDYEQILALIPEPEKIKQSHSHFKVIEHIWETVIQELKKD